MDKNQQNSVDKLFKDSLQSFQDKPDREVWEKIEQQLDEEKKRPYFFGWRTSGLVAAGLALLFILGIWIYGFRSGAAGHFRQASARADEKGIRAAGLAAGEAGTGVTGPEVAGGVTGPGVAGGVTDRRANGQAEQQAGAAGFQVEQGDQSAAGGEGTTKRHEEAVGLAPVHAEPSTAGVDVYSLLAHRINNLKKASVVHLAGRQNRWSVTGYFAQELAGYNLADHDSTAANGREVDKKETAIFSASGGLLVGYRLTKRWILQSGLFYSWSNSISDPTTAYAVAGNNGATKYQFNTPTGYGFLPSSVATGDSVQTDKSSSRLHYLSIPIIASYIFTSKHFTFLAGAGFISNILTSAKVATTIAGTSGQQPESIVTLYGLRKINYGLIFKTEMQYAFRANWSLNLMATSKNALTSINTNGRYLTYPYYIGLGLGITHTF
jgi:Outer membrane protein beta-barrel domain